MDIFSVLNYQGSKKALLDFIHKNIEDLIDFDSTILDIFSGTSSVGYSFKRTNSIYANDTEYYAYVIANALLHSYINEDFSTILADIKFNYLLNMDQLKTEYGDFLQEEEKYITTNNIEELDFLYQEFPTIWNGKVKKNSTHNCYDLFTVYYSGTYFGIMQAMAIDSLRAAIEHYRETNIFFVLLTSLFFAMKETVFAKDGHMAQPLSLHSNTRRLLILRKKNIYNLFSEKFSSFFSDTFLQTTKQNKAFHMNFEDLLKLPEIHKNVDLIYADPPYTDMQYSRYYHLLNTVSLYNYPEPSIKNGNYTKGLYVEGRYQSKLSQKSSCLNKIEKLVRFCEQTNKHLAISFAYPASCSEQKTDRYVMNIQDLINLCQNVFSVQNVAIHTLDHQHANNRNSVPKKVVEYLIVCKGR